MPRVSATLLFALSLAGAACADSGEGGPGSTQAKPALTGADAGATVLIACDPLAAMPLPITLGTVSAAGRAADGTLYVVSSAGTANTHVFVSSGQILQRKRASGSGSSGGATGDVDQTVSFEEGSTPNRLVFKQTNGVVKGIALVHDGGKSFFDELPASAEQLTIVPASELARFELRNLAGEQVLELSARTAEGNRVVVTRPEDWSSYNDFRVFYGSRDALDERRARDAGSSKSGSRFLTFDVDGADFELSFGRVLLRVGESSPNSGSLKTPAGEPVLSLDDETMGLPPGLTFRCLSD